MVEIDERPHEVIEWQDCQITLHILLLIEWLDEQVEHEVYDELVLYEHDEHLQDEYYIIYEHHEPIFL